MKMITMACSLIAAVAATSLPIAAQTLPRPMIDLAMECTDRSSANDSAIIPYHTATGTKYSGTICVDRSHQATHLPVTGMKEMPDPITGTYLIRFTIDQSKGPLLDKFSSANEGRAVLISRGVGVARITLTGPLTTTFDITISNQSDGSQLQAAVLGGPSPAH